MADPVGTWHINANGFKGTLNITSNGAGQGAPEPNPDFRLLTGSFEAIGSGASPGRARFGWVARQNF
jgi:hypothetical protein